MKDQTRQPNYWMAIFGTIMLVGSSWLVVWAILWVINLLGGQVEPWVRTTTNYLAIVIGLLLLGLFAWDERKFTNPNRHGRGR